MSENRSLSRGFLSGLEPLIFESGLDSTLGQICRAVAAVSNGSKLRRRYLIERGQLHYGEVLKAFAKEVADPEFSRSPQALATAMLLGLYEV